MTVMSEHKTHPREADECRKQTAKRLHSKARLTHVLEERLVQILEILQQRLFALANRGSLILQAVGCLKRGQFQFRADQHLGGLNSAMAEAHEMIPSAR